MARWWHVFIYNGSLDSVEAFGRAFPRGERVAIPLPQWDRAQQREASDAGLSHLEMFDAGAKKAARQEVQTEGADDVLSAPTVEEPLSAPKTTIKITKRGRGYRGSH
jgi:hypothetical protein